MLRGVYWGCGAGLALPPGATPLLLSPASLVLGAEGAPAPLSVAGTAGLALPPGPGPLLLIAASPLADGGGVIAVMDVEDFVP